LTPHPSTSSFALAASWKSASLTATGSIRDARGVVEILPRPLWIVPRWTGRVATSGARDATRAREDVTTRAGTAAMGASANGIFRGRGARRTLWLRSHS
jgi:hypothetical protein